VIHFAAYISVGESVLEPERYSQTTSAAPSRCSQPCSGRRGAIVFLLHGRGLRDSRTSSHPEDAPYAPVSPYGESKVMVRRCWDGWTNAEGCAACRCATSTPGGADPEGGLGEEHDPERISSPCCCGRRARASPSPCSETITKQQTAPACATTSTSLTRDGPHPGAGGAAGGRRVRGLQRWHGAAIRFWSASSR